jgi:hypothetical protein
MTWRKVRPHPAEMAARYRAWTRGCVRAGPSAIRANGGDKRQSGMVLVRVARVTAIMTRFGLLCHSRVPGRPLGRCNNLLRWSRVRWTGPRHTARHVTGNTLPTAILRPPLWRNVCRYATRDFDPNQIADLVSGHHGMEEGTSSSPADSALGRRVIVRTPYQTRRV